MSNRQRSASLTILVTSDLHGKFLPDDRVPDSSKGSLAHFSTLAKEFRADGRQLLVMDCGDFLRDSAQAYILSRPERSALRTALLHYVGYEVMAPGNHDISDSTLPPDIARVSCNVGSTFIRPYSIFKKDNLKIAVTGLMTEENPILPTGEVVKPSTESLRKVIEQLRSRESPDLIVGLFHAGREETERISSRVPELDLIIFSHDHAPFTGYNSNGTPMVNPGAHGEYAACITVIDGRISPDLIKISCLTPDPYCTTLLAPLSGYTESPVTISPLQLTQLLHNILHIVTGTPLTAVPAIEEGESISLTLTELYRLFPYDDYAGVSVLSGHELMASGLNLRQHNWKADLEEGEMYRVGCDSHSLPPTEGASRESLQAILAYALTGKSEQQIRDYASYVRWANNDRI